MEKQNVTLSLPKTLLKKAKRLALEEEKSFNELVKQCLEQRLVRSREYASARARQQNLLDSGFNLGTKGKICVKRDELHERR